MQAPAAEEAIARCAAALRRHHFDVVTVKTPEEAFEVMRATVEAEQPKLVSFGDSMTMRATGIIEWLRADSRWTLLDGFDASMPRPERLEIRRQALLCDLFVTGINAVTEQGTLHWLDMVGNRIAPVAFGPRKVILVAGRNKIVASREEAEERHPPHRGPAEHRPTPRDSTRRAPKRASAWTATPRTGSATPAWRCCAATRPDASRSS